MNTPTGLRIHTTLQALKAIETAVAAEVAAEPGIANAPAAIAERMRLAVLMYAAHTIAESRR